MADCLVDCEIRNVHPLSEGLHQNMRLNMDLRSFNSFENCVKEEWDLKQLPLRFYFEEDGLKYEIREGQSFEHFRRKHPLPIIFISTSERSIDVSNSGRSTPASRSKAIFSWIKAFGVCCVILLVVCLAFFNDQNHLSVVLNEILIYWGFGTLAFGWIVYIERVYYGFSDIINAFQFCTCSIFGFCGNSIDTEPLLSGDGPNETKQNKSK